MQPDYGDKYPQEAELGINMALGKKTGRRWQLISGLGWASGFAACGKPEEPGLLAEACSFWCYRRWNAESVSALGFCVAGDSSVNHCAKDPPDDRRYPEEPQLGKRPIPDK